MNGNRWARSRLLLSAAWFAMGPVGLLGVWAATPEASDNFIVRTPWNDECAFEFVEKCEQIRTDLRKRWRIECLLENWSPPCEVVVHLDRTRYLQAVGTAGTRTVGSTVVRIRDGCIVFRRIDVLAASPSAALATVAHELTHVVFAERYPNGTPPRWAEEGAALLADARDKQQRHEMDFRYAYRERTWIPLDRLLHASDYPPGVSRAVFYGQSMSLVRFLVAHRDEATFVRFVDRTLEIGVDAALHEVYGIESTGQLEAAWLASLSQPPASLVAPPLRFPTSLGAP